MSSPSEQLKVDPIELSLAAGQIDGHASEFQATHQSAHSRAAHVAIGSGMSGAALPAMLAAWEADGTNFGKRFTTHAEDHRAAADLYMTTDTSTAEGIDDAGAAL